MTQDSQAKSNWSRLTAELQAYRDERQRAWGGTDEILLARYLAGVCSAEERTRVEQAIVTHPELKEAMKLLQEVLPPPSIWAVQQAFVTLNQQLRVWLDQAGQFMVTGLDQLRQSAAPDFAAALDDPTRPASAAAWNLPIAEQNYEVSVQIQPGIIPDQWQMSVQLTGSNPGLGQASIALGRPDGLPTIVGKAKDFDKKWLALSEGTWLLTIQVGKDIRKIPLTVGK